MSEPGSLPPAAEPGDAEDAEVERAERAIVAILRTGVILAGTSLAIGLAGQLLHAPAVAKPALTVGLILLIVTPIVRVVAILLADLRRRLATGFVLAVIAYRLVRDFQH
jgi:uncharacterized integral membrane protein